MALNPVVPSIESDILIGMVFSTDYLKAIFPYFRSEYIDLKYGKEPYEWCINYFKEYDTCPGKEVILDKLSKIEDTIETSEYKLLQTGLEKDIERYESMSSYPVEYMVEETKKYFVRRNAEMQLEAFRNVIKGEDIKAISAFQESGIKPLVFEKANRFKILEGDELKRFYAQIKRQASLFKLPGALGALLNNSLVREGFVSILAPEKRGKSWLMLELLLQAAKNDLNAIMFQAGDMGDMDIQLRLTSMLTHKPYSSLGEKGVYIPVLDCMRNRDGTCNKRERTNSVRFVNKETTEPAHSKSKMVFKTKEEKEEEGDIFAILDRNPDYEPCSECANEIFKFKGCTYWKEVTVEPWDIDDYTKAFSKFRRFIRKQPIIEYYGDGELSVEMIENTIDMEMKGTDWEPDVIFIDYADIMHMPVEEKDYRHKQNILWQKLRTLALKYKCLVITATQADSASYKAYTLDKENFSEDKRKLSHVTSLWGLNQTNIEKMRGELRINQIISRNSNYNVNRTVTVLQNLETGRPLIDSYFTPTKNQ